MLASKIHAFYSELISDLDKEGKAALADAEQKLAVLVSDVKSAVTAEEQALAKQYATAQPVIQEAINAAISALEQAIVAAFTKNGV